MEWFYYVILWKLFIMCIIIIYKILFQSFPKKKNARFKISGLTKKVLLIIAKAEAVNCHSLFFVSKGNAAKMNRKNISGR